MEQIQEDLGYWKRKIYKEKNYQKRVQVLKQIVEKNLRNDLKTSQLLLNDVINDFRYEDSLWQYMVRNLEKEFELKYPKKQSHSKPKKSKKDKKKKKDKKDKDKDKKDKKEKKDKKDKKKKKDKKDKKDKDKNTKEIKLTNETEPTPVLPKPEIDEEENSNKIEFIEKGISIFERAISLNNRSQFIWQNYIHFIRKNKKDNILDLYNILVKAKNNLKYDKNSLSIWVQLTEIWTSPKKSNLNIDVSEINNSFIELASTFFQFDNHFINLFEERYSEFLKNLIENDQNILLSQFNQAENKFESFTDLQNELILSFKSKLSKKSLTNPIKVLLKDIEEVIKNKSEKKSETWKLIILKLIQFKNTNSENIFEIELFYYEKAISSCPDSQHIWRLYLEYLNSLEGNKKNKLFEVIDSNRSILHQIWPQALQLTICYFHDEQYIALIDSLFKNMLEDILSNQETLIIPKYSFIYCILLFTLYKGNCLSIYHSPIQSFQMIEEQTKEDNILISNDKIKKTIKYLIKPDPANNYQIFDILISKSQQIIESFGPEERSEIYQLILNRMKRANCNQDFFKHYFRSFSPKNILFFKLYIQYKKIIQSENNIDNSFIEQDDILLGDFNKQLGDLVSKKESSEVSQILCELIQSLNSKGITRIQKMIRFYAELYIDCPKDLQMVESNLSAKIFKLQNQQK